MVFRTIIICSGLYGLCSSLALSSPDDASTLSTRAGFTSEAVRINGILEQRAGELDRVLALPSYNGRTLPVVLLADEIGEVSGNKRFIAGRRFVVAEPSRFVIESPSWRDTLFFSIPKPVETKFKVDPVAFNMGVQQARSGFALRMAALAERVVGGKRGLMLQQSGVLAAPVVSSKNQPQVTRDTELSFDVTESAIVVGDKFLPKFLPVFPVIRVAR